MIEQERKFLLKELPEGLLPKHILQGYLCIEGKRHLRIRIIDDEKATLTFKTEKTDWSRDEFEYEVPLEDAKALMAGTQRRLTKIRFSTVFGPHHIDIDVYPDGLAVVEIEFTEPITDLPSYCGDEVTGQPQYSNLQIALSQERKYIEEYKPD